MAQADQQYTNDRSLEHVHVFLSFCISPVAWTSLRPAQAADAVHQLS